MPNPVIHLEHVRKTYGSLVAVLSQRKAAAAVKAPIGIKRRQRTAARVLGRATG